MLKLSALILALTLINPVFAQTPVGSAAPGQPMEGGDKAANTPEKAKTAKKTMRHKKKHPMANQASGAPESTPSVVQGGDKAAKTPEKVKAAKDAAAQP